MQENCKITGMKPSQQKRWPLFYSLLTGDFNQNKIDISGDKLSKEIMQFCSKQETTDEEDVTTYAYVAQDDEELGLANIPEGHAFTVFIDYNSDFDIDVIFAVEGEMNTETNLKPVNFFIQTNESN